jgi:hypothetical protein
MTDTAKAGTINTSHRCAPPHTPKMKDDDIRKQSQNLPGMGGAFNCVNLHAYHYAGNNPVVLKDPDGRDIRSILRRIAEDPIIKQITQSCEYSEAFYKAGFMRDSSGVYHAGQDGWQRHFGYNPLYDVAFDPEFPNVNADELTALYTIDFSKNKHMFNSLRKNYQEDARWTFNDKTYTATFTF